MPERLNLPQLSQHFEAPIMPAPVPAVQMTVERIDPWKEDGNIVLVAEGKYFRVHRSVLSGYSEVFKDMFDCPYPNETEKEFIEHCPVIHLHDTTTDVQIMLKGMYDRSYPQPYYERMPLSIVSAFLRLGEKYVIPAFMKEAKTKLCCGVEPTYMATASSLMPPSITQLFPAITDGDPHNFWVMNLLQEMDIKATLPIAMYQCIITCPLENVVDGYRDNGSFYSLSSANLRSFILMKDMLDKSRARLMKALRASPSCSYLGCVQGMHQLWSDINVVPPFVHWRSQWDRLFCSFCRENLKAKRETEMQQTWSEIPTIFGLRTWQEVKKSGDLPSFTIRAY